MSVERTECICKKRLTDFEKIPQPFTTGHDKPFLTKRKTGDETKKGIEENRVILKKMKEEARANEFTVDD